MSSTISITGAEKIGRLAVRVEGANGRLLAQTLNRFMAPTTTKVRRELARYTGARYGYVSGVVNPHSATPADLTYAIGAKDGWLSLKVFSPRETRKGVSSAPWNRRLVFPGAFMKGGARGARVPIPKLNGHVFVREGDARLPLHKLSGPNIAVEMVKKDRPPLMTWRTDVGQLGDRIMREVKRRIEVGA